MTHTIHRIPEGESAMHRDETCTCNPKVVPRAASGKSQAARTTYTRYVIHHRINP